MDMLLKTHGDGGADLPDDDPQTSYLISAWSRICKVSLISKLLPFTIVHPYIYYQINKYYKIFLKHPLISALIQNNNLI